MLQGSEPRQIDVFLLDDFPAVEDAVQVLGLVTGYDDFWAARISQVEGQIPTLKPNALKDITDKARRLGADAVFHNNALEDVSIGGGRIYLEGCAVAYNPGVNAGVIGERIIISHQDPRRP